MTKKLHLLLFTILSCLISISCSKDNGTDSLIEEKLDSMSEKEMLRELLIKNDNDINQLARIFECSPSTLKRILSGKTISTVNGKSQFKNILNQTLITQDQTFDQLDPLNQSWHKKSFLFIKNKIGTIAIFYLVIFIISIFIDLSDIILRIFLYSLFIIIIYILFQYIANLFASEIIITDEFKYTLDPIWEKPIFR